MMLAIHSCNIIIEELCILQHNVMFKLFWIFIFPIILSDFGRDCFGSKSRKGLPNIVKSFSTRMVFCVPLQMFLQA